MGAKATFDTVTRTITLTEAPVPEDGDMVVDLDVQVDLYGDGKEDWQATESLRRLIFPIRAVGGDTTPTGAITGSYFIRSDWKIQPYDADHRLRVNGNFYSEDGRTPFLYATARTVIIEQKLSDIVTSVFPDEQAIITAAGLAIEDFIYFDDVNGVPGQTDDIGTPTNPVDNVADALDLVASRGKFGVKIIEGTFAIDRAADNLLFLGLGDPATSIVDLNAQSSTRCSFHRVRLTGSASGQRVVAVDAILDTPTNIHGLFQDCYLRSVELDSGAETATFDNCRSQLPGAVLASIDCGGRSGAVELRAYAGDVEFEDLTSSACYVSVDLTSGHVVLAVSCTDVNLFELRGVGELTNNSSFATTKVDTDGFTGIFLRRIFSIVKTWWGLN